MKEFKVIITATLNETFIVRAEDADAAALIAKNDVRNAFEYTLNYDDSEGEYVGGECWLETDAVELKPEEEEEEYPKEPKEGTALAVLLDKIRQNNNG